MTAIENIEYINSKGDILYLGEYAKYSDSSYLDSLESKIYFASGLWGFYFYNLNYPPLHWWWQDLLNDEEYIKISREYSECRELLEYVTRLNVGVKEKIEEEE